jgi:hypothetical protein
MVLINSIYGRIGDVIERVENGSCFGVSVNKFGKQMRLQHKRKLQEFCLLYFYPLIPIIINQTINNGTFQ